MVLCVEPFTRKLASCQHGFFLTHFIHCLYPRNLEQYLDIDVNEQANN